MPSNKTLKRKGNCFICEKHNVPLCRHCSSVYVCKLHFSSHHQNDYCFPFTIGKKGIIASRDIEPFELIMFEKALAVGPKLYDSTEKVK